MQILCTLFDSNYLSRGLACYESLVDSCKKFHLYVFAFDELSFRILTDLNLDSVTVIPLKDFESKELLSVKPLRTRGEYCWTCTPFTIDHVLINYGHDHCTYIDADLFYYKDPQILLNQMGENSVLITPHYYTPKYDQSRTSGVFCVQHVVFKNDSRGLIVLDWWKAACMDWCYAHFEDGKFGDQKYLDTWPTKFEGIYVSENIGEGVAPWNIQQWKKTQQDNIIFYHYHALSLHPWIAFLGFYEFPAWVGGSLYKPYIEKLRAIDNKLLKYEGYKSCFKRPDFKRILRYCYELVKFKNNILRH